jgi:hypothetical protein
MSHIFLILLLPVKTLIIISSQEDTLQILWYWICVSSHLCHRIRSQECSNACRPAKLWPTAGPCQCFSFLLLGLCSVAVILETKHMGKQVKTLFPWVDVKGFWRWCEAHRISGVLDFFHRPVFLGVKSRHFGNFCSRPQTKREKTPTQLGPLERANLSHCQWRAERDPGPEESCSNSQEHRAMEKFHNPSNSVYYYHGSTPLCWVSIAFFSFLILYTDGRTPWTGNQPVARPLPIYRTT